MITIIVAGKTEEADKKIEEECRLIISLFSNSLASSVGRKEWSVLVFAPEVAGGNYHIVLERKNVHH